MLRSGWSKRHPVRGGAVEHRRVSARRGVQRGVRRAGRRGPRDPGTWGPQGDGSPWDRLRACAVARATISSGSGPRPTASAGHDGSAARCKQGGCGGRLAYVDEQHLPSFWAGAPSGRRVRSSRSAHLGDVEQWTSRRSGTWRGAGATGVSSRRRSIRVNQAGRARTGGRRSRAPCVRQPIGLGDPPARPISRRLDHTPRCASSSTPRRWYARAIEAVAATGASISSTSRATTARARRAAGAAGDVRAGERRLSGALLEDAQTCGGGSAARPETVGSPTTRDRGARTSRDAAPSAGGPSSVPLGDLRCCSRLAECEALSSWTYCGGMGELGVGRGQTAARLAFHADAPTTSPRAAQRDTPAKTAAEPLPAQPARLASAGRRAPPWTWSLAGNRVRDSGGARLVRAAARRRAGVPPHATEAAGISPSTAAVLVADRETPPGYPHDLRRRPRRARGGDRDARPRSGRAGPYSSGAAMRSTATPTATRSARRGIADHASWSLRPSGLLGSASTSGCRGHPHGSGRCGPPRRSVLSGLALIACAAT